MRRPSPINEPQGKLPGQCANGELLRHTENRARPQREYPDREAARHDLFADIEGYYNRQRIHSAIAYITPEQADPKTA
jgi:transposase InsO family protein